jgi:hypothetical protein
MKSRCLTLQGVTKSITAWARETGISTSIILMRLWRGWSVECGLTEPVNKPTYTDRFNRKLKPNPDTGCIEWQGTKGRKGYGLFCESSKGRQTRMRHAHRVAWELAFGPIPKGWHILRRCDNPPCCNRDHLCLGTDGIMQEIGMPKDALPIGGEARTARLS